MQNNDVLRRLRFALDMSEKVMAGVFAKGGHEIEEQELAVMLLKEEDEGYIPCTDVELLAFLDGLITHKRGPRPDGTPGITVDTVNNNLILKKLRIALELKEDDIMEIMALAEIDMSKNELTAIFRNPGHRNYRECKDQFLRNFLKGLTKKLRGL